MKIEFNTDNAAFCNPDTQEPDKEYRNNECRRILNDIKAAFAHDGKESGIIKDSNGNVIGHWEL